MSIYRPNSIPQERFLSSPADICIYGGQRGGGKTAGLQLESGRWIHRQGFYGVLLRETLVQIKKPGGMFDEGYGFYASLGGVANKSELSWRFPSGAKLAYGHLETNASIEAWRGAQVAFIGIDQMEMIRAYAFWALLGSNRSMTGIKPYVRGTCNPDPDSFLYMDGSSSGLISWWIDGETGIAIPERSGKIRYFVRDGDTLVWGRREELLANFPGSMPLSVSFIPASVYDNRSLMERDPTYIGRLMAMPLVERERMLGGNWKIREAAGMTLRSVWFKPGRPLPHQWRRIIRSWDLAGSVPTPTNPDPDWTAGVKIGQDTTGLYWILDVTRFRKTTGQVEDEIAKTARLDGIQVEIIIEQEGGSAGIGWPESIIRNKLEGFNAKRAKPIGNKLTRARILGGLAEGGKVYVPDTAHYSVPWLGPYMGEMDSFVDGTQKSHDDQVDATSAAVIEFTSGMGVYAPFEQSGSDRSDLMRTAGAPQGVFMRNEYVDDSSYDADDFRDGLAGYPGLGLR